jgi:hypothetical protein
VTAETVIVIAEALLLGVLAVFVVALLRSHAEILRRLAAVEPGSPDSRQRLPVTEAGDAPSQVPGDLVGQTPGGDAVKLALTGDAPRTLVAFLSSGCAACEPLWATLRAGAPLTTETRVVVVTKGPERESVTRVRELAGTTPDVVMSTIAWEGFAIPATPHFVLVDGSGGRILGRGSAASWEQIGTLLHDAEGDAAGLGGSGDTSSRAARAEDALARGGVHAGHPSLYPSREAAR